MAFSEYLLLILFDNREKDLCGLFKEILTDFTLLEAFSVVLWTVFFDMSTNCLDF